ncbi:DNA primase [bacterium]|nr:DNA primase [bacterium]
MENDLVSQIKERLDIIDVISKDVILKKQGGNYWGLCPFHKEKTPSFSVNPTKGIYKCFGCGEGGDALTYLLKTRGLSFGDLIKELAEQFGLELPKYTGKKTDTTDKDKMIKACTDAADFYQENLYSDKDAKTVLEYLKKRGIDENIVATYGLGFAPKDYDTLYKILKKNYSDEILEKAGLILKTSKGSYVDRFRNRVTIPILDETGNTVAFGARAVENDQNPKYLNSSDSPIYNKKKLLYGLYYAKESIKELDSIIIMEGYFDVISAQANGVRNCVASCGTSLTTEHIKLISRYSKSRKIYLAFDTDTAGQNATNRGARIIKDAFLGLGEIKQFDENFSDVTNDRYISEIRVIAPPQGKDPDEFIRANGKDAYMQYVEHAPLLIDFQINQALKNFKNSKTPVEKSNAVKDIIPILLDVRNKIIRSEYIKMVSSALDIDEKSLASEIEKADKDDGFGLSVKKSIVTKSSNIFEKTQKNILSLYLVNANPVALHNMSKYFEGMEFDGQLKIVKDTIDKLSCKVDNVKELIEQLYVEFANNNEIKNLITDLICLSEAFENLDLKDFQAIIFESITKFKRLQHDAENKKLKEKYQNVNDNDIEALKLQIQLRDKINSRTVGEN